MGIKFPFPYGYLLRQIMQIITHYKTNIEYYSNLKVSDFPCLMST